MAGYNENYVAHTVESAYQTADDKTRITFGVSEHRTDDNFYAPASLSNIVRIHNETVERPMGVSVNRNSALDLYDGEKYILNIDPHILFMNGWDTMLISNYESAANKIGYQSVMTFYLPTADGKNGKLYPNANGTMATPVRFTSIGTNIFRHFTNKEKNDGFALHYGLCGHNQFSIAENIYNFKFDPDIFFYGEEQAMSLRYASRGYKMFAPYSECYGYHLDKTKTHVNYKADALSRARVNVDDYSRIRDIFTGGYFGHWGAPDQESLTKYIDESGFNYKAFLYLD